MILFTWSARRILSTQLQGGRREFWGWLNAVFNKVDYERIKAVGPDRAAAEWLLRCGAKVRFRGFDRWQHDYNGLPTGPLGRYRIEAIDATESCIMYRGFDHLVNGGQTPAPTIRYLTPFAPAKQPYIIDYIRPHETASERESVRVVRETMRRRVCVTEGLEHVEEIRLNKCIYIEDVCLERLSQINTLQNSVRNMSIVSCGNVTDKGLIALHHLGNLEWLFLSDLPGVKDKDQTVDRLQTALPKLTIELDLA